MAEELRQEDIDALLSDNSGVMGSKAGGTSLSAGDLDALLNSAQPFSLPDFAGGQGGGVAASPAAASIEMLNDVELNVRIELGRTRMCVEDILKLREGSVVSLDKDAGAPVDIMVNGRLVATGEVLVLNDFFCVRVTEILSNNDRALMSRI